MVVSFLFGAITLHIICQYNSMMEVNLFFLCADTKTKHVREHFLTPQVFWIKSDKSDIICHR